MIANEVFLFLFLCSTSLSQLAKVFCSFLAALLQPSYTNKDSHYSSHLQFLFSITTLSQPIQLFNHGPKAPSTVPSSPAEGERSYERNQPSATALSTDSRL